MEGLQLGLHQMAHQWIHIIHQWSSWANLAALLLQADMLTRAALNIFVLTHRKETKPASISSNISRIWEVVFSSLSLAFQKSQFYESVLWQLSVGCRAHARLKRSLLWPFSRALSLQYGCLYSTGYYVNPCRFTQHATQGQTGVHCKTNCGKATY